MRSWVSTNESDRRNVTCSPAVADGPCVGCGVCTGVCPSGNLSMRFDEFGKYVPSNPGECRENCGRCADVCPLADSAEDLAPALFASVDGIGHAKETGYYLSCHVGHAVSLDIRIRGASGGVAGWFLGNLIERGIVDRVVCVTRNPDPNRLFKFTVIDDPRDLEKAASSAYYPVEMTEVIRTILNEEARYALIALPCFVKGIRLAMQDNRLRSRIVVAAGLACNHLKSTALAGLISRRLGVAEDSVREISFRHKMPGVPSDDPFARVATSDGASHVGRMADLVPRAWPAGLFKLPACNYCADHFAELADICFMDAWLPDYARDWRGNSIVLVRSELCGEVIRRGVSDGRLEMKEITADQVIASQRAGLRKKQVLPCNSSLLNRLMDSASEQLCAASHGAMRRQRSVSPSGAAQYAGFMRRHWIRYLIIKAILRIWPEGSMGN